MLKILNGAACVVIIAGGLYYGLREYGAQAEAQRLTKEAEITRLTNECGPAAGAVSLDIETPEEAQKFRDCMEKLKGTEFAEKWADELEYMNQHKKKH